MVIYESTTINDPVHTKSICLYDNKIAFAFKTSMNAGLCQIYEENGSIFNNIDGYLNPDGTVEFAFYSYDGGSYVNDFLMTSGDYYDDNQWHQIYIKMNKDTETITVSIDTEIITHSYVPQNIPSTTSFYVSPGYTGRISIDEFYIYTKESPDSTTGTFQQWGTAYPNSPLSSEAYPYQCIVRKLDDTEAKLYLAMERMYATPYGIPAESGANLGIVGGKIYSLVDGQWEFLEDYATTTQIVLVTRVFSPEFIEETVREFVLSNHDILEGGV